MLLGDQYEEFGYSIECTEDGGTIIAGITASYGSGERDACLIKLDSDGEVLWDQAFGGTGDETARHALQTDDGDYILTGTRDVDCDGESDLYLIRTDAQGNQLWSHTFGGEGDDSGNSLLQCPDGGFLIAGRTASFGAGGYDLWLIKTDPDGGEIWSATYGGPEDDLGYMIQPTTDGGYVVAGYTESFGNGQADIWLVKTDASGEELWTATFGGTSNDFGACVKPTDDGGYVIVGETHSFGSGGDVWLIKTDAGGNTLWQTTFGGVQLDGGYPGVCVTDGGYVLCGWTKSYGKGDADVWVIRTDASGQVIWDETYGGAGDDRGLGIQEVSAGKFIITGYSWVSDESGYDLLVLQVDEEGTGTPVCDPSIQPDTYQLHPPYPNPFNDQTRITFELPRTSAVSLVVYDIGGRQVAELANGLYAAGVYSIPYQPKNLSSGIYLLRLQTGERAITQRFVLLR
jgi:hypothetical protein